MKEDDWLWDDKRIFWSDDNYFVYIFLLSEVLYHDSPA